MKPTSLLANCVILHTTTLDLMNMVREFQAEGWEITGEDLAAISPYLTDHIMRFGTYVTTELTVRPDAFDPHLEVEFEAEEEVPAAACEAGHQDCRAGTPVRRSHLEPAPSGFDSIMPKTLAVVDRLLHHAHIVATEDRRRG